MKTTQVATEDLRGVFAVPPLALRLDANRALDLAQNFWIDAPSHFGRDVSTGAVVTWSTLGAVAFSKRDPVAKRSGY